MSSDALNDLFEDVPFQQLLAALRTGKGLRAWSDVFERVVARVAAALRRRFPDAPYLDDAVQSACRTFFDRARQGQYELQGPGDLVGLLVVIALRKATRRYRQALGGALPLEALAEPADPAAEADESAERRQELLASAMREQLRELLGQVEAALDRPRHRAILPLWFEREWGGRKITKEEIGQAVGCSRSTVDRVIEHIEEVWPPLLLEARDAVRELEEQLRAEGA
jgi:RNA polymerase sigma factor (sigma-70 family)